MMKNKYVSQVNVPTAKSPDLFHLSDRQLNALLKATDIEITLRKRIIRAGVAPISSAVYQCYAKFLFSKEYRLRKSKNNKLYLINKKRRTRKEMYHNGQPFYSFCIRYADKTKLKPMTHIERTKYFK